MKFTSYFMHMRQRPDRARIRIEWIEDTIKNPDHIEVQADGRIRKWKKIGDEGKFLRIILLPDGKTVHNAFLIGASEENHNENKIFFRHRYGIV